MTVRLRTLGLLAFAAIVVGVLAAWSGLVPLGARSGHWAITEWFLHFTMRRTVKSRSSQIEIPPLGDTALVLQGAGHYESGCRPCHGAPGSPRPAGLQYMTPRPPDLMERVPEWEPEELFWIVKHGIKFTGMPGWPAVGRDDEVWAMVAFLLELPRLEPEEYRELAFGERRAPPPDGRSRLMTLGDVSRQTVEEECSRCHGDEGLGRGAGAFPKLAGQREAYLHAALVAYARGERASGIMQPVAAGLSSETMREIARYYSALPGPRVRASSPGPDAAGEAIAREGIPAQRVASCADCHGPSSVDPRPAYPRLAGQPEEYLVNQLELFKAGRRGGTPFRELMDPVVHRLSPEAMRAVARYYAALGE